MIVCAVEVCTREPAAGGWCKRHYMRWWRYGDPLAGVREFDAWLSEEHRFWSKVDASGDCWIWTAGSNGNGYGRTRFQGRSQYAHRVAWELLVGPVTKGLVLDHLCRNRSCVNPDHLEPVADQENFARGPRSNGRAVKTHCPNGHLYSGHNLYIDPKRGWRGCRACRNRSKQVAA